MAGKKTPLRRRSDGSWNFILLLTLTFILTVIVANSLTPTVRDIRAKAGFGCPDITVSIPDPDMCQGRLVFTKNSAGCPVFVCEQTAQ